MIFIQTIVLVSALLHIFGIEVDVAEGRSLRHVHSPEHYLANAFHTNAVLANPYPVIPASNLSPWAPGLLGGVINQPELTGPSYNTLGNGISANTAAVFNGIDGALTDPLGSYNLPGVPLGEALTTTFLSHGHSLYSVSPGCNPLLPDSSVFNHLSHPFTSSIVPSLTEWSRISSHNGYPLSGLNHIYNPITTLEPHYPINHYPYSVSSCLN